MQQWIVLLRGVNVGAHNQVSMPDLRLALEAAGYRGVTTYLRSGNVILTSEKHSMEVADDVHRVINDRFSVRSPIVVRSPEEWRTVIESGPFSDHPDQPDDRMRHVIFLAERPDSERLSRLGDLDRGADVMSVAGREVFISYADGMHGSPLQHNTILKRLDVVGTARNWRTVLAVADRV